MNIEPFFCGGILYTFLVGVFFVVEPKCACPLFFHIPF